MKNTKKGQLENLLNWFIALAVIFFIIIGYMVVTRPFQTLDQKLSPEIDIVTKSGKTGEDVLNLVRKYWIAFPVILIAGVLLWAYLSSLKQDPNYPYG